MRKLIVFIIWIAAIGGAVYVGVHKAQEPETAAQIHELWGRHYLAQYKALKDKKEIEKSSEDIKAIINFEIALRYAMQDGVSNRTRGNILRSKGLSQFEFEHHKTAIAAFTEAISLGNEEAGVDLFHTQQKLAGETLNKGDETKGLLIAWDGILTIPDAVRKKLPLYTLKNRYWPLVAINSIHATIMNSDRPASEDLCDKLASDPEDPLRASPDVFDSSMNAAMALDMCTGAESDAAFASKYGTPNPNHARLLVQRAHAHRVLADKAVNSKEDATKSMAHYREHHAAMVKDLEAAMQLGYPVAFHRMARAYQFGEGVKADPEKSGDLAVEALNRTLACCWEPVARHLLARATDESLDTTLRIIAALTPWSAAVGSKESAALQAQLIAQETIPTAAPLPPAAFTDLPPWLR